MSPPPQPMTPRRSRRRRHGTTSAAVISAVLVLACALTAGCGSSNSASTLPASGSAGSAPLAEAGAGGWKTFVLTSPDQVKVPPPPAAASDAAGQDASDLAQAVKDRSPASLAKIHKYSDYPATAPWTQLNMDLVSKQSKNPPLAARGYGLVAVAMYDTIVTAWHWKYVYNRTALSGPDVVVPGDGAPSYPDEHVAIAAAATRVLAYLFPELTAASYDQMATEAADARVANGSSYRSDVDAGLELGRSVAAAVIARARADGSDARWDGTRPQGTGYWQPPPGTPADKTQPVEPLAGTWKTWIADSASQVAPPPPPAYGSPQFLAELQQVVDTGKNLTDDQKRIATYWAAGAGTPLPPGLWNQIALDYIKGKPGMSTPREARLFAYLNVAEADAGVDCWAVKFQYWTARPVNAAHDLNVDASFKPFLPTPVFPSYMSGHATFSGAASTVLSYFFPADTANFQAEAQEAALSRLLGGIHYKSDNDQGLAAGTKLGTLVVQRAKADGAPA